MSTPSKLFYCRLIGRVCRNVVQPPVDDAGPQADIPPLERVQENTVHSSGCLHHIRHAALVVYSEKRHGQAKAARSHVLNVFIGVVSCYVMDVNIEWNVLPSTVQTTRHISATNPAFLALSKLSCFLLPTYLFVAHDR